MNETPDATSANEQELLEAEREWADVVMRKDKVAADSILADEFRLTGPELQRLSTGRAATKDVWLETLPLIDTRSFNLSDAQITVYGRAAVVFVRATIDWSIQGRPLPSHYMLTDLWVQREGRWQVVTRLSEPLG
jgi:ketosteroid isomerase-like protein